MSHQTKYASRFSSIDTLCAAMERLGFKRIDCAGVVFTRQDTHTVTLKELETGEIEISTDLNWGHKSTKIKSLLGVPQDGYEALATIYNEIQLTEHFQAEGCEVEVDYLENGEVQLIVTNQSGGWN